VIGLGLTDTVNAACVEPDPGAFGFEELLLHAADTATRAATVQI
jgi:hypothetical protein